MEIKPKPAKIFESLNTEKHYLDRLRRRITYLEEKAKSLGEENKNTTYEIAECNAIKWAYEIAFSAHRTNERYFKYFAVKFKVKEKDD